MREVLENASRKAGPVMSIRMINVLGWTLILLALVLTLARWSA